MTFPHKKTEEAKRTDSEEEGVLRCGYCKEIIEHRKGNQRYCSPPAKCKERAEKERKKTDQRRVRKRREEKKPKGSPKRQSIAKQSEFDDSSEETTPSEKKDEEDSTEESSTHEESEEEMNQDRKKKRRVSSNTGAGEDAEKEENSSAGPPSNAVAGMIPSEISSNLKTLVDLLSERKVAAAVLPTAGPIAHSVQNAAPLVSSGVGVPNQPEPEQVTDHQNAGAVQGDQNAEKPGDDVANLELNGWMEYIEGINVTVKSGLHDLFGKADASFFQRADGDEKEFAVKGFDLLANELEEKGAIYVTTNMPAVADALAAAVYNNSNVHDATTTTEVLLGGVTVRNLNVTGTSRDSLDKFSPTRSAMRAYNRFVIGFAQKFAKIEEPTIKWRVLTRDDRVCSDMQVPHVMSLVGSGFKVMVPLSDKQDLPCFISREMLGFQAGLKFNEKEKKQYSPASKAVQGRYKHLNLDVSVTGLKPLVTKDFVRCGDILIWKNDIPLAFPKASDPPGGNKWLIADVYPPSLNLSQDEEMYRCIFMADIKCAITNKKDKKEDPAVAVKARKDQLTQHLRMLNPSKAMIRAFYHQFFLDKKSKLKQATYKVQDEARKHKDKDGNELGRTVELDIDNIIFSDWKENTLTEEQKKEYDALLEVMDGTEKEESDDDGEEKDPAAYCVF